MSPGLGQNDMIPESKLDASGYYLARRVGGTANRSNYAKNFLTVCITFYLVIFISHDYMIYNIINILSMKFQIDNFGLIM